MRKWLRTLLGSVALVAASAALFGPMVSSATQTGEDAQATIAALQTEVASLQTQVAANSGPLPDATPTSTTEGELGSVFLGGEQVAELPTGEPGDVSVIASGLYSTFFGLPVIVRNASSQEVMDISVAATARDSADTLIAAGSILTTAAPIRVVPGGIAIGTVDFGGVELPPDVAFSFEVSSKPAEDTTVSQPFHPANLIVDEASRVEDRIVGMISNPHDVPIQRGIFVLAHCFDAKGNLLRNYLTSVENTILEPGASVPFQVTFYEEREDTVCPTFLAAAYGYPE